jgi:hypothetical protein
VIELLLVKLNELKVKMYQEAGHHTPHVHIDYGRHNHVASYAINEPKRLAGTLDTKYDRTQSWIGLPGIAAGYWRPGKPCSRVRIQVA